MEGMSRVINKTKEDRHIKGINISNMNISHLLVLDDAMLCGVVTFEEWSAYRSILDLFCHTIGMLINTLKYSCL